MILLDKCSPRLHVAPLRLHNAVAGTNHREEARSGEICCPAGIVRNQHPVDGLNDPVLRDKIRNGDCSVVNPDFAAGCMYGEVVPRKIGRAHV